MSALEFQQVSKTYGQRIVLNRLTIRIESGERVVLQGPSGCGKTTALRLFAGFLFPDEGNVLVGNRLVATAGKLLVEPERRQLGMVFQDLALWPHMTIARNLEFVLKPRSFDSKARRLKVSEMLSRVRLEEFADTYPSQLSGGQQQRIAIARALIAQPQALLMDEPLANLDDELKDQLCEELLRLHSEFGFTLVYVTHSNQEAVVIGTRTIRLRSGSDLTEPVHRSSEV